MKKRLSNLAISLIIGFTVALIGLPARITEYLNPGDDMITAIIVQQIGIGGAIVNRILSNALGFGLLSLIILSIF